MYFINDKPTPILNTPNFSDVFGDVLLFDDKKLVRAVEMIALPSMVFKVIQKKEGPILEISTEEYPLKRLTGLFMVLIVQVFFMKRLMGILLGTRRVL